MINLAPQPEYVVEQPVLSSRISGRVTQAMRYWLLSMADRINGSPLIAATVTASTQAASIGTTNFAILQVQPGVYRLSMAARVTRAATTSSSLTVTFGWTSTVACTTSSAAITGNTTATTGSLTYLVRVDEATAITYATTYASVGGVTMQYQLDVLCEQVM
jgi:hypothetical protein